MIAGIGGGGGKLKLQHSYNSSISFFSSLVIGSIYTALFPFPAHARHASLQRLLPLNLELLSLHTYWLWESAVPSRLTEDGRRTGSVVCMEK